MHLKKLVVVGGGATGSIVVITLAQAVVAQKVSLHGVVLHLIDQNGFGCGGIAYGQCSPKHILNTQRQEMSPWEPDGFKNFVLALGRSDNPYTFDHRADFKKYLDSELEHALTTLTSLGATIIQHTEDARVRRATSGYTIVNSAGILIHPDLELLAAENIVLAVGYGPNKNFEELKQYGGYIHSLYPFTNVTTEQAVLKDSPRVAVFGSAAALYDFILACPSKPESTELYVFSAAGSKAQEVREVENEHQLKEVPLGALTALSKEGTAHDIETAIEAVFAESHTKNIGPETWVAFCIMNMIGDTLRTVSADAAIEFRRSTYCMKLKRLGGPTSFPASQALAAFNPTFIASNIASSQIVKLADGSFKITNDGVEYTVDCIVNATGHGRHNTAILEDLKAQGLAVVDPHTDVLATDETGYRLVGSHIACAGPATHFGTDGVQTFARPAERIARELVKLFVVE